MKGYDVVHLLNQCIEDACTRSASDVHISASDSQVTVSFRVDGILDEYAVYPAHIAPQLFSRLKVLINADITRKNIPQEGRFCLDSSILQGIDMRVIIIPTVMGEKAVIRLLNRKNLLRRIDDLGMHSTLAQCYRKLLQNRQGLILICGATGSGKTTTLYSSLLEVRSGELSVVTVEDPVEYLVDGINQVQVNKTSGLGFADCLRYILRMDPDIIFVGEVRDRETAALACSAALTGHLVVATLHTSDSLSAVTRLHDMGIEPFMIAHSLRGVLSQTLVPQTCSACRGDGCQLCAGKGVQGRTGIFELLEINTELRELIVKPPYSLRELREAARGGFYMTFEEEAIKKLDEKLITQRQLLALRTGVDYHGTQELGDT